MRSTGRGAWSALVLLGVLVSIFEALGAALIFALVAAAAGGGGFAGALPDLVYRLAPWVDGIDSLGLGYVIAGFFVVRAVLTGVQAFLGNKAVFQCAVQTSHDLMRDYLAQGYPFHVSRGSAELIRNVRESVDVIAHQVLAPLIRAMSESLVGLGLVAALFLIAPAPTMIVLGSLAIVGTVTFWMMRVTLVPLGRQSHDASMASLKAAQELLRGIRDIKLLKNNDAVVAPFLHAQRVWGRANYWRSTLHIAPRVIAETTLAIVVLIVLVVADGGALGDSEAIAVVGLFAYAALRLIPASVMIFGALNGLNFGAAALGAISEDLSKLDPSEVESPTASNAMGGVDCVLTDAISLRDVWHYHPGAEEPALRNVSLRIPAGSATGIVGPSGSGKSTIVDLIIGLLMPTDGTIEVDGQAIDTVDNWRRSLGVVSQAPFLADDTILKNIAFGEKDEDIDLELVTRIAELVHIDTFATPDRGGLSMSVGEHGFETSGGERQRIALARALYRSPEVLILDEATSALDPSTEDAVLSGVEKWMSGKTLVVVAHRSSAIARCDHLIMLSSGMVAMSGSFSVVSTSDEFRMLMTSRASRAPS